MDAPLKGLQCDTFEFRLPEPESDGRRTWDKTTMVVVRASAANHTGIGFGYADEWTAHAIRSLLFPLIQDRPALDIPRAWLAMRESAGNTGQLESLSQAIATVDIALWDLKAKLLGLSLSELLGRARPSVPACGSGGFPSLSNAGLEHQVAGWMDRGIRRVKIRVGGDPVQDRHRLRAARQVIGLSTELLVDANGAFRAKQALRFAEDLSTLGVTAFEEPVALEDLGALHLIRTRAPAGMDIVAGGLGSNPRTFAGMLQAQAIDAARIDPTRCLGITGFLEAVALCNSAFIPVSASGPATLNAHLCCAISHVRHVEYDVDDAWAEKIAFEGALEPVNGELVPDLSRPGLGIELKNADLVQKRVA